MTHPRRLLFLIVAAGVLGRVAGALWQEPSYDLVNVTIAADLLQQHGLSFFGVQPVRNPAPTYPYVPLFATWGVLVDQTGAAGRFEWLLLRLPMIAADAVLTYLVGRCSSRHAWTGLFAAAIYAFHPVAFVNGAVWSQLDPVAFVPALLAAFVWRRGGSGRAVRAGLLLGLAIAIKTPAVLVLAGLLAVCPTWREARTLLACALGPPLLVLAPFAIAEPAATAEVLDYTGNPGAGGLSLLAQPNLVNYSDEPLTALSQGLQDVAPLVAVVAVAVAMLLARRRRADAVAACAMVILAVEIAGVNWYPTYVLWMLPFVLLSGGLWWMAASTVVMLPYTLSALDAPKDLTGPLQVAATPVFLLLCAGAFAAIHRRAGTGTDAQPRPVAA